MVSLTKFGVTSGRFTVLAMIALLALGIAAYFDLSKREDPSITIRTVVVTAEHNGMAPIRIEELIVDPIERTARQISEIDDINTLITAGKAVIKLNIDESVPKQNLQEVFEEIRNKMNDVKRDLPDGTVGPSVNTDYGDVVVATIAVTGEGYSMRELREFAKDLRAGLYRVDGVGKVDLMGVQEERVWLEIDSRKLAAVGVQINQVLQDLQAQNVILSAGQFDSGGTNLILEANGELKDLDAIRNVLTRIPDLNTNVKLDDLLNVRRGYVDPLNTPTFYNGHPAIMVGVQMSDGEDIQVLGKRIQSAVAQLEQQQPIGVEFNFSTYQETKVTEAVNNALSNVVQTALVVLLVLIVFLGWRPAIIVACIVPFTVMFSVIAMAPMSVELQVVSIAAVILALGLLVDNGLVVVEDIQKRIDKGETPDVSAYHASAQFGVPLAVASITTVAAFIPLLILEGTEGEYGYSLGAVVGLMLAGSWIAALYFLPTLCVWFAKPTARVAKKDVSLLSRIYGDVLQRLLPLSILVIVISYGLVIASSQLFGLVSQQMFPLSERSQYLIYMDMPKGTAISETKREALSVERWLSDSEANPEVANTTVYVGDGGPRFYLSLNPADTDPASAFFLVNTVDADGAITAASRAQRYLFEQHPAARFKIKRLSMGGSESGIVDIKISGPDADRLLELAEEVEVGFSNTPDIIQNEHDWGNKVFKVVVDIAQDRARSLGITSKDISEMMDAYYSGTQVSEYREGVYAIPIVVRAERDFRDSLEDLENLSIPVQDDVLSLDQIAVFVPKFDFSQLRRENQQRTIKISAKSATLSAGQVLEHIQPTLENLALEPGYAIEIAGETADSADVNSKLGAGVPVAFIVMVAAIMFQFNSFRRVTLVLMTIPFIIIGAPVGLILTGQPLSFFGTLGIIALAGIIINNAIVLIDQIDIERRSKELKQAIIFAAQQRITPILLTTLTTVFGLTPMAINGGALFEPMATLMIGGLALGSTITLLFVPVTYYLMFRRQRSN
ncbi:MAG: efflux RND transporter permease subunit [Pseudomonadota bacterium]